MKPAPLAGGADEKARENWEINPSDSPRPPQLMFSPDLSGLSAVDQNWAGRILEQELAACDEPDVAAVFWLEKRGVDPNIISGNRWPGPIRVADIVPWRDGGGTFRFATDADGDGIRAFVHGCPLSRDEIEGLVDLVAWQPRNSCIYWLRWGVHRFIPEKELHLAAISEIPFCMFANPLRWLAAGGEGYVDCCWSGAPR